MKIKFTPVKKEHLKRLSEIVNVPDVAKFITITPPVSMKSTIEFYEHGKKNGNLWWVIIYDAEVAGSVSLERYGKTHKLKMGHIASLGIAIDKPYWNLGIGEKAIRYALKQAKKLGFKRVDLYFIKSNKKAGRLYKRCGFKTEGTMKKYFRSGNRYLDAVMMAKII